MKPSELLDSVLPCDADAERAVIGSVLLLPACLDDVAEIVQPNDFYSPVWQAVFAEMLALGSRREPIDAVTVVTRLRQRPIAENGTLDAAVAKALHDTPHALHATHYARIVREKAMLRGLIRASTESLRAGYAAEENAERLIDEAEQRLQALSTRGQTELVTATQLAMQVGDHIDAVCERGEHLGLPTGLTQFDESFGGLFAGELVVLAARPSVGKSALAAQISDYLASSGRQVYFASLEMSGRELAQRTICALANVDNQVIRKARLLPEDYQQITKAMRQYTERAIVVDTRADLTVEALARTVRRLATKGLELAVVDYLGLLASSDRKAKRYEQVGHQTRALKLLARETGVCLLLVCQLNRASAEDGAVPQLHNLRESGSIEQDADTVLFIHRPYDGIMLPDPDNRRNKIKADWPAELIIAKQRNGATGRLKLDWEPRFTRFSCWDSPIEKQAGYEPAFSDMASEM